VTDLRPELPPLPAHMRHLRVDRGYPVPWFVAWVDKKGRALTRGRGTPDFRITHPNAVPEAHNGRKCWICGGKLGRWMAFTVGPMCAVNKTSSEPPSHTDCADWAARACPFLARPHARRREAGKPEGSGTPGVLIPRNPGVALVWITQGYWPRKIEHGVLFTMGAAHETRWYCEGRPATRAEVEESIRGGLVELEKAASGSAIEMAALANDVRSAMAMVPA